VNQKLSDWASIAEIVSSIAIIVTLVLLIAEVRGNTSAVRAATFQSVSDSIAGMGDFALDRELVGVFSKGLQTGLDDPLEETQFGLILASMVRRFENAYYQRDLIEPELWQGIQNSLDRLVSGQGFGIWWNEWRLLFSADFQELVDGLRSDTSLF